jgi:hypothetical protein
MVWHADAVVAKADLPDHQDDDSWRAVNSLHDGAILIRNFK